MFSFSFVTVLFITLKSADSYRLASLHDSSSNTYNLEASLPSENNRNEESKDRNRWTLKTGTELRENTVYSSFSHGMVPDLVESKTKLTEHISHILEKTCACIPTIFGHKFCEHREAVNTFRNDLSCSTAIGQGWRGHANPTHPQSSACNNHAKVQRLKKGCALFDSHLICLDKSTQDHMHKQSLRSLKFLHMLGIACGSVDQSRTR